MAGLYETVLRPLLFQLDPELVHNLGLTSLSTGLIQVRPVVSRQLEQTLFDVKFPNPLGLAAGFDKNGVAVPFWDLLGFGFAEIGTVTYMPQPGNPKPRIFRLPEDQAIINRLGFNNKGAEALKKRLLGYKPNIPIGINMGKSKLTPIEDAPGDYRGSFELLHPHGDYFVINVSSPNTPGLRGLQDKSALFDIIQQLKTVGSGKPLFVKIAPDLELSAVDDVIEVAQTARLTGIIATNTTISRPDLRSANASQEGGLSGAPLKEMSDSVLRHLYKNCDRSQILIGVGGIFNGADLFEKISYGAHLAQIYTGWVYGGPATAPRILAELLGLMRQREIPSLAALRGSAA